MGVQPHEKTIPTAPTIEDLPRRKPDGDYHTASRNEAVRALGQNRLVYAVESSDGTWGQVVAIEDLLEQGHLTPACTVHFVSGHARAVLDGEFLVEHDQRFR